MKVVKTTRGTTVDAVEALKRITNSFSDVPHAYWSEETTQFVNSLKAAL